MDGGLPPPRQQHQQLLYAPAPVYQGIYGDYVEAPYPQGTTAAHGGACDQSQLVGLSGPSPILSTSPSLLVAEAYPAMPLQKSTSLDFHTQSHFQTGVQPPKNAADHLPSAAAGLVPTPARQRGELQQANMQQMQQMQQMPAQPYPEGIAPTVVLNLLAPANPLKTPSTVEAPPNCKEGSLPAALCIRNTFLDAKQTRSPSLDRVFEERLVRSCPASGPPSGPPSRPSSRPPSTRGRRPDIISIPGDHDELPPFMINTPTGSVVSMLTPTGEAKLCAPTADARHMAPISGIAAGSLTMPKASDLSAPSGSYPATVSMASPPPVLRLSEVISEATRTGPIAAAGVTGNRKPGAAAAAQLRLMAEDAGSASATASTRAETSTSMTWGSLPGSSEVPPPNNNSTAAELVNSIADEGTYSSMMASSGDKPELGSPALPTRGSALHRWGACKPCAFMFKEGCNNGIDCQFCHLCEPGERKRRKKERLAVKRDAREQVRQQQGNFALAMNYRRSCGGHMQ